MSDRGILVVVSGFSVWASRTLMNALLDKYLIMYCLSQLPQDSRVREKKEGIHYFYRTGEEFE